MRWWDELRYLARKLDRRRAERELEEEIQTHLALDVKEKIDAGYSAEEARFAARRAFGSVLLTKEKSREMWGFASLETLWQDLRCGARMLWKRPGFASIAILTLALGIGANTAIFSIVDAVLMRPLPFKTPERLALLSEKNLKTGAIDGAVSGANFTDWRRENRVFDQLSAFMNWNYNLTGDGEPQRLNAAIVSAGFFQILGVGASYGRVLLDADDQDGRDDIIVLSHTFWQSRFGARPDIIGERVQLNGRPHTIVGVMPPGFSFPSEATEIWRPMALSPQNAENRSGKWLRVIGRLKADLTWGAAQVEMETLARRLEHKYPASNTGWGVQLASLHEALVGKTRRGLLILIGAVGFVLLMACANVANLLFARAAVRQKEMAVRAALGAGRWRLLRQLLTENLLLMLIGATVGLWLAQWGIKVLIIISPVNIPRLKEAGLDGRALSFTLLLSLLTTLLCGIIPAWRAAQPDLNDALKEDGRNVSGQSGRRLRHILVVAEVAVCLVLLAGAGLMLRSFINLQRVNVGFNPHHLLTMQVMLPSAKYGQNQQQIAFFQQALERIRTLPGVQAADAVQDLPLRANATSFPIEIEGRPKPPATERPMAAHRTVSENYFRTIGIPLLNGRAFTSQDDRDAPPVIVVNRTLARRFWPTEDPLGKQIRFGEPGDPAYTIVGVVGDIKHLGLDAEEGAVIYQPHAQKRFPWLRWMTFVVRTDADPSQMIAAVRSRLLEVDTEQPVYDISTLDDLLARTLAQPRFALLSLGLFGCLALLLAGIGIYGVMSFAVSQRTHEIGIRLALGAQSRDVLRMVIGEGMRLATVGVALGLIGALLLTRMMKSLLFGVGATDPTTFAFISLLILGVALLACYLPARRAMKADPMIALRND
jgi:putative ABC transport system permease protein